LTAANENVLEKFPYEKMKTSIAFPGYILPLLHVLIVFSNVFFRSHVYKNLYSLHNDYQAATIEKLHAILRANINILEDVYMSLRSLQESQRAGMKFCQQTTGSHTNAGNSETSQNEDITSPTGAAKTGS
jgi:hypothetical protein